MKARQQIFDEVCAHLKKQGGPAFGSQYLCDDGSKCAIGGLIPDDKYDPDWDNTYNCAIKPLSKSHPDILDVIGSNDVEFLSSIQTAHDLADHIDELMAHVAIAAKKYNLNPKAAQ